MSKSTAVAIINPNEWANRIVEALAAGLVKAAGLLREYIEKGGDIMALQGATPVNPEVWRQLSDVATGRVLPEVYTLPYDCMRALMGLPPEQQRKAISEGVDVLSQDGSPLRVRIHEATPQQRRLAFARDHLRTIPEQKAVAATLLSPPPPTPGSRAAVLAARAPEGKAQIEVRDHKVYIVGSAVLDKAELLRLLGLCMEP